MVSSAVVALSTSSAVHAKLKSKYKAIISKFSIFNSRKSNEHSALFSLILLKVIAIMVKPSYRKVANLGLCLVKSSLKRIGSG